MLEQQRALTKASMQMSGVNKCTSASSKRSRMQQINVNAVLTKAGSAHLFNGLLEDMACGVNCTIRKKELPSGTTTEMSPFPS